MPLDGIVVRNIIYELKNSILNAKIDKINQPERDEIIFTMRSFSGTFKLLISAHSSYPRVHFTTVSKENPQSPPMFCTMLRKHLLSGKVVDIIQPVNERIIEFHIVSPNDIGDMTLKKLIIEIMGKHSNIILVDENNKVLDSIKRITHEISRVREVLPGSEYFMPPSDKINPLEVDFDSFVEIVGNSTVGVLPKVFLKAFNGFSTVISNEIAHRYLLYHSDLDTVDVKELWDEFSSIITQVKENKFTPIIYSDTKIHQLFDFSSIDIAQYIDYKEIRMESISEAIEYFYREKDLKERIKQKSEDIKKHLLMLLDRNMRKLERLKLKIEDSKDKEKYKIYGDLIFANIHEISEGDRVLNALNYYSETQENAAIPLDSQLSPSENAQKYYKIYNKLKTAESTSFELIESVKNEIGYLESVLGNIDNCVTEDDINQIRNELAEQGYIKRVNTNRKKVQNQSKPLNFTSSDGFSIFVGKNNLQNDELTLKIAQKNDIWLHTKHIHGSHVIIKADNKEVPDNTLIEAAGLAAYYSKAKHSNNVQVDYTNVKNVKKPSGAKPGMVIYENYRTVVVNPKENLD